MKAKDLREKNIEELKNKLFNLLHEQFHIRMKFTKRKSQKSSLSKQIRRDIAKIKTILREKVHHD